MSKGVALAFMAKSGKVLHWYSSCVRMPSKFLSIWLTGPEYDEKKRQGYRDCIHCQTWRQGH